MSIEIFVCAKIFLLLLNLSFSNKQRFISLPCPNIILIIPAKAEINLKSITYKHLPLSCVETQKKEMISYQVTIIQTRVPFYLESASDGAVS